MWFLRLRFLFLALGGAVVCSLPGEQLLNNPAIPDGEHLRYTYAFDDQMETITESVNVRNIDGREVYVDTFLSPPADRYLTVDRNDFRVMATHTIRHGPEAEMDNTQIIRETHLKEAPDNLRVPDFYGLRFLLRGYPFEHSRTLQVNMLNTQDEVTLKVRCLGDDPMEVMGSQMECIKLELSFMGIVGPFLTKTQIWYQKAAPHYLVCYQGASEFNRKVKCLMKLVGYGVGSRNGN
jgi:hypothetical protein